MQSMDEIYEQYALFVYRYLLSLTGREELAEELTQETFFQAIRCIDQYNGTCKISTWLCAIGRNQYLAHVKKNRPHLEWNEETVPYTEEAAENLALSSLSRMELMKKLHGIQEPLREVLYLRIFGDLSFREIGEIMNQSENWARVNFYRGKEKMAKEINDHEL